MWAVYVLANLEAMFMDEDDARDWANESFRCGSWKIRYHEVEVW